MLGYWVSRSVPLSPAPSPDLKINWNSLTETWANLKFLRTNRTVFLSILGISWFWFYGAMFLSQFPNFTKDVLGGSSSLILLERAEPPARTNLRCRKASLGNGPLQITGS